MQDEAVGLNECLSCNGMNTSCPDGCGRDPKTGELNGGRCDCDYCAQPSPDVAGLVSDINGVAAHFSKLAGMNANNHPHWPSGLRPFSTGDVKHLAEALPQAATALTTQAARIAVLEGALTKCADIVDRHLYRQSEKVEDVKLIARAALETSK